MAQRSVEWKVELADQLFRPIVVPSRIERLQVREQVLHCHPFRQFLILRNVADMGELQGADRTRIDPQNFGAAGGWLQNIHEDFDRGGFSDAIRTSQAIHAALRNGKVQTVEHWYAPKMFYQIHCGNQVSHSLLLAAGAAARSNRDQWLATASVTASRSKPRRLASTTSCSTSFFNSAPRSAAVDAGSSATTVPRPGRTSIRPSATSW